MALLNKPERAWQFSVDVYLDDKRGLVAEVTDGRTSLLTTDNPPEKLEALSDQLVSAAQAMKADATAMKKVKP